MTTLLSWLSVDNRGPSAIYIVTDSRVTWGSADKRWDSGRKVFATMSADIFGYCGDVLFPSLVLGQLSDLIDRQLLWQNDCDAETRHSIVLDYLKSSFERRHNAPDHDFTIVHCSRDGVQLDSQFRAWRIDYQVKSRSWVDTRIDAPHEGGSRLLVTLGSGSKALNDEVKRWNDSPQGGTARALFSAFCDALEAKADPLSGGMPQLVSVDRRAGGKVLGFVSGGIRYIHGLPIEPLPKLSDVEWVDSLFQRISPETLQLLSGAQRHARVKEPKKGGLTAFLRRTSR